MRVFSQSTANLIPQADYSKPYLTKKRQQIGPLVYYTHSTLIINQLY